MDEETLKDLLMRQALGDEDAIAELAAHWSRGSAQGTQDYEEQRNANYRWRDQNPDIANSPEAWALAQQADANLARNRPELTVAQRLEIVEGVVREVYPDVEASGYSADIKEMAGRRTVHRDTKPKHTADIQKDGRIIFDEGADPIGGQIQADEQRAHEGVQELIAQRQRLREEAGDRAQRFQQQTDSQLKVSRG